MNKFLTTASILILIIGVWFLSKSCNSTGGIKETVRIDTVIKETVVLDTVLLDNPIPYKVTYYKDRVLYDTLETIETVLQHVDSAKILAKYLARRNYDTTVKVDHGTLRMTATVTQNRLLNTRFTLKQKFSDTSINKTVTKELPKRVTGYFGVIGLFNKDNVPYASGVTFDLQFKNGAIIGLGGLLTRDDPMALLSLKYPLHFGKR